MTINEIAAALFRIWGGTIFVSIVPKRTPNKLAKISAEEAPRKTARGAFFCVAINMVASWVLSPNSAKKTIIKVIKKLSIMGSPQVLLE